MSLDSRPSQSKAVGNRPAFAVAAGILLAVLLAFGGVLYLRHPSPTVMSDDEGGYAYAAWRIGQGEVPYRDFLTSQMPVFLYWGGLVVGIFGRSILALRATSLLAMLAAAGLLYALSRELFDPAVGLVAVAIFLVDPNVCHNARFYRPEAYMLALSLAGLYGFVLAEKLGHTRYLSLAGICFGLSIGDKLFGALLLAGCLLYLLYLSWRERRPWQRALQQALALGLPAVAVVGLLGALFTRATPYFLTAVFFHHTMQGAGLSILQRAEKALRLYVDFAASQPLPLLLAAGGTYSLLRRDEPRATLPIWQIPTALAFLVLSRELFVRHLTYLAPALAMLIGVAVVALWRRSRLLRAPAVFVALAVIGLSVAGDLKAEANTGQETRVLAATIQKLTTPEEQVVSDYTGFNFAAARRSTYWSAGMSGGAAASGQIRGQALIDDIEQGQVGAVLINTLGNGRQMLYMEGYTEFRRYVQAHFALVAKLQSGYRQFEVYARQDIMPIKPAIDYGGELELTGLSVSDVAPSGTPLEVETRWLTLAPMASDYHVSLRLVDATGHLWAQRDEPLMEQASSVEPSIPDDIVERQRTSSWQPGQVVLQKHSLRIPFSVPPGTYSLAIKVYDLQTGFPLPEAGGQGIVLAGGGQAVTTLRLAAGNKVAAVGNLPIAVPLQAPMAEGLTLLGSGPVPARVRADRSLALDLFWQSPTRPAQDYRVEFRLLRGREVLQRWPAEVSEGYPTSTWQDGEITLGSYSLPLTEGIAEGHASLEVVVLTGDGREAGPPQTVADDILIEPKPDPATLEQRISHPLAGVTFAGRIGLLGYDLSSTELGPGDTLVLTLYWECLQPVEGEYKVFTHLLDSASQVQGQADAIPDGGQTPTSRWRPGDVLVDRYEIPLQPSAGAGPLQVELGFYDPPSGKRLPVERDGQASGEDRVLLPDTITVR